MTTIKTIDLWTEQYKNHYECFNGAFVDGFENDKSAFDEKKIVAENIYTLLKKYNGIWITCDVTPKKFIQTQDKAMPEFNKNLNNITMRNSLHDRFEDINHVKSFFGNIGFDVMEIHKFSETKEELYSVNHYDIIDEHIKQLLEDAIVVAMKIKET